MNRSLDEENAQPKRTERKLRADRKERPFLQVDCFLFFIEGVLRGNSAKGNKERERERDVAMYVGGCRKKRFANCHTNHVVCVLFEEGTTSWHLSCFELSSSSSPSLFYLSFCVQCPSFLSFLPS